MKLSPTYLYIIIALKIFILVLIGISTKQFIDASDSINLTDHTIDVVDQIIVTLLNGETGQRGFIITGEDRYLEPYLSANIALDGQLNDLQHSLAAQNANISNTNHIIALSHSKMSELDRTVKIRQNQGFEAAQDAIKTDDGKMIMDQIRDSLSGITTSEVRRSVSLNEKIKDSGLVIFGGVIAFFALFLITIIGVKDMYKIGYRRSDP